MARPSGLKGNLAGLSAKAAEQLVLKGYPLTGQAVKLPGKARRFRRSVLPLQCEHPVNQCVHWAERLCVWALYLSAEERR